MASAFLLAIGFWQASNFVVGRKLKKHFAKRKEVGETENKIAARQFEPAQTSKLLPEADFSNTIQTSVTENSTRHLAEKISRKSS